MAGRRRRIPHGLTGQGVDAKSLLSDPSWFPDATDPNGGRVRFMKASREALSSEPFLDERWSRDGMEQSILQLGDLPDGKPAPRLIWHTAFCCSTLLARCLDKPGVNLSLKEPAVLMEAANVKRTQGGEAGDRWLSRLLPLLARPFEGDECVTLKPTNTVNNMIADTARLAPGSRHLFLTSNIKAFLVSIAKKGESGRAFARKLFTIFAMDGHAVARTDQVQLMRMSDLQIAALVWHMQIASMQAAMAQMDEKRWASLDGDAFLADPEAALKAVDEHFQLGLGEAHARETAAGPLLTRDAKDQSQSHGAQRRAEEAAKIADQIGAELDQIIEWSYGIFPNSPKDGKLKKALV